MGERKIHLPVYIGAEGDRVWTTDRGRSWTAEIVYPAPPGAAFGRVVKIYPDDTAELELESPDGFRPYWLAP